MFLTLTILAVKQEQCPTWIRESAMKPPIPHGQLYPKIQQRHHTTSKLHHSGARPEEVQ